ncbi:MAG: hypothetical protein GXO32_02765 [Crenarchaeota archaeon]|nr:hypothetical protein [Thermoproteota archaeon]
MVRTCIVTHVDLDAIASAALYVHCAGAGIDETEILFIPPRDIVKALARTLGRCSKVVIADLGLNSSNYREVAKLAKRLREEGAEVEWFDHHVWDREWIEALRSAEVNLHLDRSTCAAGIISKVVCGRCTELARIACSVDLWVFDRWEAPFLYRIAEYYSSDGRWIDLVKELIELNCDPQSIISRYIGLVEEMVSEELNIVSRALEKVMVTAIGNVKLCIYAKDDSERRVSTSLMCNAMLGRGLCDVAVVVRRDLRALSLRSKESCNVREIAKALGGGGHPRAAGAPLSMSLWTKLAVALARAVGLRELSREIVIKKVARMLKEVEQYIKAACGRAQ